MILKKCNSTDKKKGQLLKIADKCKHVNPTKRINSQSLYELINTLS